MHLHLFFLFFFWGNSPNSSSLGFPPSVFGFLQLSLQSQTHHLAGNLIAIRIKRWDKVDAGFCHQVPDAWISILELLAYKLHQHKQQLPTQHLIAMDASCIAEFWLSYNNSKWKVADTPLEKATKSPYLHQYP